MAELTPQQAAAAARRLLGAAAATPAAAWRVVRLDREGDAYFLVVLGDPIAPVGVAAIEAVTGEAMSHARLSGAGPHLAVDAQQALRLARLADADADLVWRPCAASLSPLYPIWRVASTEGCVFIDQQGRRWDRLSAAQA